MEEVLIKEGLLQQEHLDEIRRMFKVIDTDNSGEISTSELATIMTKLSKGTLPRPQRLQKNRT